MKKLAVLCLLFAAVLAVDPAAKFKRSLAADAKEPRLAHNVYFSLKDSSDAVKEKLVADCRKLFAGNSDVLFFAIGGLAKDLRRPVNDQDFDVSVLAIFKDKAAHDNFQKADLHLRLIEENKGNWKKVRVFDSYLEP